MKPSLSRALTTCRRECLNHAGHRSARLAAILHRFMRRWSVRMALDRPVDIYRPALQRLTRAYLSALESERFPSL